MTRYRYPDLKNTESSSKSSSNALQASAISTLASLLAVSLPHLDSEAEMRKFFGSKAVHAAKSDAAPGSSSSPSRNRHTTSVQKSNLTHPQSSWWAAKAREGLTIASLSPSEILAHEKSMGWNIAVPGENWCTVEYSKRYRSMTMSFIQAVMAGDPEQFYRLIAKFPWHADTLLQLSEVFRHREEYSQAVDFVERALFTYERAFLGSFSLTSGLNR